jgi:preprotein translocase subunit SecF
MFKSQAIRLLLFGLIVGGAIYLFATGQVNNEINKVKGDQINLPPVIDQQVKKITNQVLPESKQIIEQTELAQEIEKKVDKAMEDVKGFSEEQKKEIKKQIIKQIANQLIKQIEENE